MLMHSTVLSWHLKALFTPEQLPVKYFCLFSSFGLYENIQIINYNAFLKPA